LPRRVESILQAVVLLGFREVRNLVIGASVRQLFRQFGPEEEALWEHAIGVAAISRMLADRFARQHRELAYLAGQLHDVGKIIIRNQDLERYRKTQSAPSEQAILDAEQTIYGFTHTDVGGLLLQRWNLPKALETATFCHHDIALCQGVDSENTKLTACVSLADYLCDRYGVGVTMAEPEPPPDELGEILRLLDLDGTRLEPLAEAMLERFRAERKDLTS
jgi:HD-like signal output (HDOD) protein